MKKLVIKEGELKKFNLFFDKKIHYGIEQFIKDIEFKTFHHFFTLIKSKEKYLLEIYGDTFGKDFFNNINIDNFKEKKEFIIKIYKKYDINNYIKNLEKIVIYDNLNIIDCNSQFLLNFIFSSDYRKIIKGNLVIRDWNINKTNAINNFEIEQDFELKYSAKNNIKFVNCKFGTKANKNNNYIFKFNICDNKIVEFENTFFNQLYISYTKGIIKGLIFDKCSGNIEIDSNEIDLLHINNSDFSNIIINNNKLNKRCKISSEFINGEINTSTIGSIYFSNNTFNDLRIGHSKINNLELNNLKNSNNSEINLGNLEINKFTISSIRNLGKIRIYDLNYGLTNNSKNSININNSSIGNSEFQNVNINSFKDIVIYDNLFSDLKYTGISWGYIIKVDKKVNYGKLRNTYRTLKDVAEKNNDNITALKFYSLEMEAYKQYLKTKKNNKVDLFIIWFNEFSSDYGLNFVKPLLFITLINAVFIFSILLLSSDFVFTPPNLENIGNFLGYFSKSINLTNGINDIFLIKPSNGFYDFLVLLKNILIGLFVYQLVLAFRKFSRKI